MRSSRRARPEVVTLEGRTMMSGASIQAPWHAADVSHHRVQKYPIALNGRTVNLVVANHSGLAKISGKGHLSGLGRVTITGTVNSQNERPLLETPWLLYADLVIASHRGDVNIRVTPGTIGLNPFAQPVHLQYSIRGGTGAYRNATGKGLVDLSLFQAIPETLPQLKAMGNQLETQGIPFKIHFHPGHLNQWGNFASMWYKVIQTVSKHSVGHSGRGGHKPAK